MPDEPKPPPPPPGPQANLGQALSCLGTLQVQIVQLLQDLATANSTIDTMKKEAEEKQKAFDEGKKSLDGITDELKFYKAVCLKRPRAKKFDPMEDEAYLKRILSFHDWSRAELSTLSCVSKAWRKYCQSILFARLKTIFLADKQGCDEMTAYLDKKKHLAEITTTVDLSFKSAYGAVGTGISEFVPVSVLKLLEICKNVNAVRLALPRLATIKNEAQLRLTDMAAFIGTAKVLKPVSQRLTSLSIDPQSYANHGKSVEFSLRPQGILADWKKLQELQITRCQLLIHDKVKAQPPLTSLTLNQVLVSGSLWVMLQGARKTLTTIELMAVTGLVLDDLLMTLADFGPNLTKLALRSCRYLSDFSERTFDPIFATCTKLEHLNIDLSELPIASPGTLLANQPNLTFVELKKADYATREDWATLFGAKARGIKTLNIVSSAYWNPADLGKLQERYRWMGVGQVHFIKTREE